jgi:hypothetical protein
LGHSCTDRASLPGRCFKVLALGQGSSNSSMVNKRLAPDNFRADSADAAGSAPAHRDRRPESVARDQVALWHLFGKAIVAHLRAW